MRTGTAWSANTSPKAPACASTARTTSTPWPDPSTPAPARHSAGRLQPRNYESCCADHLKPPALWRNNRAPERGGAAGTSDSVTLCGETGRRAPDDVGERDLAPVIASVVGPRGPTSLRG